MNKIATHNSATGEQSSNILTTLISPFYKCQNKTLIEQYLFGCRYFDIKVKLRKNNWIFSNGLWGSKRKVLEVFDDLERIMDELIYVKITLDKGKNIKKFQKFIDELEDRYKGMIITSVNTNNPKSTIKINTRGLSVINEFLEIGRFWQTYIIPIPKFWKNFYYKNPEFNSISFIMVDFL